MKRSVGHVLLVCAQGLMFGAVGCGGEPAADDTAVVAGASNGVPEVRAIDDCDPSNFLTLCAPNFNGGTTLPEFQAELAARRSVGAWKLSSGVNVKPGNNVNFVSRGGETHTITVVANFGGGKVPGLNTASGNPVPAPECLGAEGPRNVTVAAGSTHAVTTGAGRTLPPGTYKVQCCIHPWMRSTIEVR